MGALPGQKVDHWNHDTLDMQRENLRRCTSADNSHNMRKHVRGSSAWKGVLWNKKAHKWQRRFTSTVTTLSCLFTDEREAALTYDTKARELFGDFACTNF